MYAIIEDGSHQFRVREGDRIRVDRRDGKAGDELVFSNVLLITEPNGDPTIGTPVGGRCPSRGQDRQSIQGEENHHPEIPAAQKCSPSEWSSPTLHDGPDHERRSALTSRTRSPAKFVQFA